MSKRKFGFEGFGLNRQARHNFDRPEAPQRLYMPSSDDNHEDPDIDNIEYDQSEGAESHNATSAAEDGEIDPLDAFMEGIHDEISKAPAPAPSNQKVDKYREEDEEYDPMESFLHSKKDVGLALAADALNAGYGSDEEVYAAAKAVDAGMVEYDSDDNPIVVDKRKIEPIPALDHSVIDYEPFNKDFYDEKPSILGKLELIPYYQF